MKAHELRIGNWVNYKNSPCQWVANDFYEAEHNSQFLKRFITAIPLTEEWLINFGFDFNNFNEKYYFEKFSFQLHLWRNECEFVYHRRGGNIFIKYVHQLQNLYFALTGEELEYKP